jgi:hypothetical protein
VTGHIPQLSRSSYHHLLSTEARWLGAGASTAMSFEESAAEVAEDYSRALEDLTMNSRVEIMNLTSIARDNTEYAHAISETLLNHVKRVSAGDQAVA